jgi:hypothetical protein
MFLGNYTFAGLHGIISQKTKLLNQLCDLKEIGCIGVYCSDWFRMGCNGGYIQWGKGGIYKPDERSSASQEGHLHDIHLICHRTNQFGSPPSFSKFYRFMSKSVSKLTSHFSSHRCHLAINATGQNLRTKLMSRSVLFSCPKSSVAHIKQVGVRLTPWTCAENDTVRIQAGYRSL